MTSKRARKLMMSAGISRNDANRMLTEKHHYWWFDALFRIDQDSTLQVAFLEDSPVFIKKSKNEYVAITAVCIENKRAIRLISSWKEAKRIIT